MYRSPRGNSDFPIQEMDDLFKKTKHDNESAILVVDINLIFFENIPLGNIFNLAFPIGIFLVINRPINQH